MATLPFGASTDDTGEFMLGRIAVTPVFLESDGSIDQSTENWSSSHINTVLNNIQTGLNWWTQLLSTKSSVHTLDWVIDTTFAATPHPSPYEPISRPSDAYVLWVSDFLSDVGFTGGANLDANVRAFNNSQRQKFNTDWAFTIFVVNSVNDGDGSFAPNGSFARAFAFAGGLFEVVPSTRPASTFAHETGHIFWSRDEYSGGGDYKDKRGYYNAQNTNAMDGNPNPGFQQQVSIMSAGGVLQSAYTSIVSPDSTLAQIGWKDSDGDGIFDVLDVPLQLQGTGRFNSLTNQYRFVGKASPQTLPNQNSAGTQNDITLNRIGRIEYRLDGGSWTTVATPNSYLADVDFSVPIPSGRQRIEIRAIDPRTGITSNLFSGSLTSIPDTTTQPGIQGFAWNDLDNDNVWDPSEVGYAGASVVVVDGNSQPVVLQKTVEPDDFGPGFFSNPVPGVRLDVTGADASGSLAVFGDSGASTGTMIFKPYSLAARSYVDAFKGASRQLRVRFDSPTSFVSIDAISITDDTDVRMEAFAADGSLLKRTDRKGMLNGQRLSLEIGTDTPQIAMVIIRGMNDSFVKLDNVKFGPRGSVKTASDGSFVLPNLPAGSYRLAIQPDAPGFIPSNTTTGVLNVDLAAGSTVAHVDFGLHRTPSPWTNPRIAEDVDNGGAPDPLDVLLLINEINQNQSRPLIGSGLSNPPYYDVNGDYTLSPLDILQVINFINRRGSAEGETRAAVANDAGQDSSTPFHSFVLDTNSNQPNTWILNRSTRNRLPESGPDKCGCPACSACAPAGEYSPSILDIAIATNGSPSGNEKRSNELVDPDESVFDSPFLDSMQFGSFEEYLK